MSELRMLRKRKRGRGRPRADSGAGPIARVSVYLTADQIDMATRRGGGNLSLGLRRLLCELAQE